VKVINLETNEEDFNIIVYCTPSLIRRKTNAEMHMVSETNMEVATIEGITPFHLPRRAPQVSRHSSSGRCRTKRKLIMWSKIFDRVNCFFFGHSKPYGGCCCWCLKGLDGEK